MFSLLSKNGRGSCMYDVVSLGEIMCRLSPLLNERLSYCNDFKRRIGGAEFNVVAALSNVGIRSAIITKIPANPLGIFAKNCLRSYGVSDDLLIYDNSPDARLGTYYTEDGAYPRKTSVVYDRKNSSFCSLNLEDIDRSVFNSSKIFHTTGISLALDEGIRENLIEIIKRFKLAGVKISFDVNFRANLWDESLARETIMKILPYVDIFFCSEETANRTFLRKGSIEEILKGFSKDFDISIVASTKRTVHSPKNHSFTSYMYDAKTDKVYTEKPYENIDVVDRIGSGDAYIAGALYGLIKYNNDCLKALQYGNAFSVLKNTILGDILRSDIAEINSVIASHNGTGSTSEMNR